MRKQHSSEFDPEMATPLIQKGETANYGTTIQSREMGETEIDPDLELARQLHNKLNHQLPACTDSTNSQSNTKGSGAMFGEEEG